MAGPFGATPFGADADSEDLAVPVCNDALGQIGQPPLDSLEDPGSAARLCRLFYPPLLDAVLREHLWTFARTRVELTELVDGSNVPVLPLFEYGHQFPLPDDCIRILRHGTLDDIKWKVEGNMLLTTLPDNVNPPSNVTPGVPATCKILYIARITDPTLWDMMFFQAFTSRLASKLAMPLSKDYKKSAELYELYKKILLDAEAVDSQVGTPDKLGAYDLTDVRDDTGGYLWRP